MDATELKIDPNGSIHITASPSSPIHIYSSAEKCDSPRQELARLKETLRKLSVKQSDEAVPLEKKIQIQNTHSAMEGTLELNALPCSIVDGENHRHNTGTNSYDMHHGTNSAVLSALRALQDKVKRIEKEKAGLVQECATLKVDFQRVQAEALALEKKQDYDTSVLKESAKSAMDAIKCERDDIKLKYVQHVERTKGLEDDMQRLQRLLAESDSCIKEKQNNIVLVKERNDKLLQERQANMTTIAALTKSNHQLEQQCQSLDRQVQTLNNDVRHQSDYGDALLAKIKQFEQGETQQSTVNYHTHSARLSTADLQVPDDHPKKVKKAKKVKKRVKKPIVIPPKEQPAAKPRPTKTIKVVKRKKKLKTTTNKDKLTDANGGSVPFLLGKSASPSFSVIAAIQETLARAESFDGSTSNPAYHTPQADRYRNTEIKDYRSSEMSSDYKNLELKDSKNTGDRKRIQIRVPSLPIPATSDNEREVCPVPSPTARAFDLGLDANSITNTILFAEKEFDQLNAKYKQMSAKAKEPTQIGEDRSVSIAELNQIITALESKGKQLYLLKCARHDIERESSLKHRNSMKSLPPERYATFSPESSRKKNQALTLLREYRQHSTS